MIVNVNDLILPKIHPKIIKTDVGTYQQLEDAKKALKENWLATTGLSFVVLDNRHAAAMLKDKRWHNGLTLFSDANPYTSDKFKQSRKKSIISLEGEDHNRLRKLVSPFFSPKTADAMRPYMRTVANELIDYCMDKDTFDIQKEIYDKFPMKILSNLIGVPDSDWELFGKWATNSFKNFAMNFDDDHKDVVDTQREMSAYTSNLIEYKKNNLSNDLISMLLQAKDESDSLTTEEIYMLIQALTLAGIDTMRHQLGLATIMLNHLDDDIKNKIAQNEDVSQIVEEIIRMDGVFKYLIRIASEDIEYNGVLFPKGTIMAPALAAGNFDENVFPNSEEFDYTRSNLKSHSLSFGGGIHYCLGASLARAQMEECLHLVYNRMPKLKICGEILYRDATEATWGAYSIPVKIV